MEPKKYEVGGRGALTTLIVLSLLWFMSYADRSIMAVALQPIKEAFKLSDEQAGLLASLTVAGIAILTIPGAIFGDRWARRKVVMVMALVWSVFTFTTGLAKQVWQLLFSRFFVGAGEAGYAPAGLAWVSVSFRKDMRSLIIGIFFGVSQAGAVAGLILGGLLIAATHDWRTPFFVFAIPGIILGIIAFFLRDYKVVKGENEAVLSKAYFKDWVTIFKVKSFWLNAAANLFLYFTIVAITIWMPALLMRAYHMNPRQAGLTYGLLMLVVLLGPLGGFLADRWQRHSKSGRPYYVALTAFLALSLTLITFLNLGAPLPRFLTLLAVTQVFYAINVPVGLTIINDIITPGLRSTAVGINNFIAQIIGSTGGTIFVGAVSDALGGGTHGLQWGIIWTLPIAALVIVANLVMVKFYPAESAKISDELLAEK